MERKEFGKTGILVTPLCIGTGALGNMPETFGFQVSFEQAYATLEKVFEGPFNFMDTSSNYGDAERRIGEVIRAKGGLPRDSILQTKVDRDSVTNDFSGDQVKKSLEQSLRLLGLDYLPIVYIHDPEHTSFDAIMGNGGALEALQRYKKEGVISHIGIGGGPIGMLIQYIETGEFESVITHNRFNLIHRAAEPLLDAAAKKGIALVNAAPFGSGILADDRKPRFAYQLATFDILSRVDQMKRLCRAYGISLKAAALQFSVRDPRVTATIVGATEPQHIDEYLALLNQPIPDEFYQRLNEYAIYKGDPEAGRFTTRVYSD